MIQLLTTVHRTLRPNSFSWGRGRCFPTSTTHRIQCAHFCLDPLTVFMFQQLSQFPAFHTNIPNTPGMMPQMLSMNGSPIAIPHPQMVFSAQPQAYSLQAPRYSIQGSPFLPAQSHGQNTVLVPYSMLSPAQLPVHAGAIQSGGHTFLPVSMNSSVVPMNPIVLLPQQHEAHSDPRIIGLSQPLQVPMMLTKPSPATIRVNSLNRKRPSGSKAILRPALGRCMC